MRNGLGKYIVALVVVLVGAGAVVATGFGLNVLQVYQPRVFAQAKGAAARQHVYLTLQTFPESPDAVPAWEAEHHYKLLRNGNGSTPTLDPHEDWVTYGPSTNLRVPAHSTVTITIYQYDSGGSLLNDFYSPVRGTIGNTETVNGKTISSVAPDQVGHTFTIHGIPDSAQPWLFVNAPLPLVPDARVSAGADNGLVRHPNIITLSFNVGAPGHYVWQCEYPCGTAFDGFGGPMNANGYMNGNFDVA